MMPSHPPTCSKQPGPDITSGACRGQRLRYIIAASPTRAGWHGYLAPDIAMTGYDMPPLGATTEQIMEAAIGWAVEAGRVAAPEAIAAALAKRPGPFGDGVDDLMNALGFRFGQ